MTTNVAPGFNSDTRLRRDRAIRLAALHEVLSKAESAEATHHKYADSYEEGKRDMADQFCQTIEDMIKREEKP